MPAKSEKQRELMAIAEHKPDILYDKNKKILGSMSKGQMHDFAATKGLPSDDSTDTTYQAQPLKQYGSTMPRTVAPRSLKPRSFVKTPSVQPKMIRIK